MLAWCYASSPPQITQSQLSCNMKTKAPFVCLCSLLFSMQSWHFDQKYIARTEPQPLSFILKTSERKRKSRILGIPKEGQTGHQLGHSKIYPDPTKFILQFHMVCSCRPPTKSWFMDMWCTFVLFSSLPLFKLHCFISGLSRLLHQPTVRLRRVTGGGPGGSEEGGRQTGPRHAWESKGQRSTVEYPSVMHNVGCWAFWHC